MKELESHIPPEEEIMEELRRIMPDRPKNAPHISEMSLMRAALNNLPYNLLLTWMVEKGFFKPAIYENMTDEQRRELWKKKPTPEEATKSMGRFSEKYSTQSFQDMANDISEAIQNCGLDETAVKEAIERARGHDTDSKDRDFQSIFLPIYLKLRKMGYSHKDVTA